ncbi:MAG: YggT family protein, partial [Dokdonella sp.]
AWALLLVKRALIFALTLGLPTFAGLAVIALADLIGFVLMVMLVLIIVRVIMSFVGSDSRHPVVPLIHQLTEPLLLPIRRRLSTAGGLDFSPVILMLAFALLQTLLVAPLLDFGLRIGMSAGVPG